MTPAAESYDNPLKSILCLITAIFFFSFHDVITKWISGKYPVHEVIFLRSCFAIIPILLIVKLEGGLHLLRTNHFGAHVIRSFLLFCSYLCFYLSLAALPLSETVSLFYTGPIFITILSVIFLGEKVEFRSWVAVLVGFLGVIIMLKPGSKMVDPAALLALLSAFLYAIVSVITRRLGKTESGVSMAFYTMAVYIVYSAILGIALNNIAVTPKSHLSLAFLFREWQLPLQGDLFLFVMLGLFAAGAFYFISQAYRLGQPSTIAPFEYIYVPLSAVLGYVLWKDTLELQSVIGMVLIVGSGIYIFKSKQITKSK